MKLSAYTIAKNCSDLSDVNAGIDELNAYLKSSVTPNASAYIRLHKLAIKKQELEGIVFKEFKIID